MSRFYVPRESVKGKIILVDGDEAHHIIDVMRLKPSDEVTVFDGSGKEYSGTIKSINNRAVAIDIIRTIEPAADNGLLATLIQAIPKKAKMDYIVEKATELGVSNIMPVFTARTIPDWDAGKRSSSVERWRRIAREASKQCSRKDVPVIDGIKDFGEALNAVKGGYDLALIPTLSKGAVGVKEILPDFKGKKVIVAIGPEGDFTPEEVADAVTAGFKPVSLGPRVLKSDTAGLAVLAILGYALSE